MARNPTVEMLIRRRARQRGLDESALLAVASTEGLYDPTGDVIGGRATSFGPFMLHEGGALPRRFWGRPDAALRWSLSQAGINYAVDRLAPIVGGKRGKGAVAAAVTQFERPRADLVAGEIAKASSRLGQFSGGSGALTAFEPPPARKPPRGSVPAGGLDFGSVVSAANEAVGLGALSPGLLTVPQAAQPMPRARRGPAQQQANLGGGTFKHKRGKTINFLAEFARPFGVQITSTTHGNHVKGSYHYRGRAVDFGGDPRRMAALARAALSHPQDFAEMFYTGPGHPGAFIKDGQVIPLSELDHSVYANHKNHVHLAR